MLERISATATSLSRGEDHSLVLAGACSSTGNREAGREVFLPDLCKLTPGLYLRPARRRKSMYWRLLF